jgi:hypothetical protein
MLQDETVSGATDRWNEDGESEDRYRSSGINDDLQPALPVGECLVDKLLVVVGSKISRVVSEAVHYKFTLFCGEELGGRRILKDGSVAICKIA